MIKAILWDNDGLLVDSERVYFEANRQALLRAGIHLTQPQFSDISLRQGLSLLELARERGWTSGQIAALREERDAHYLQLLSQGVHLLPGVEKTLAALKGSVRMAIVTSSQRVHFDAIHDKSKLLPYFDFVLTREDFAHGKPAPDGYLEGVRRLGLPPDDCLAVEDSERGLMSAVAAGVRCVVVPNAQTANGDFSRALAILSDVSQLVALLQNGL
jgi:HAD superfamily hydrolase (TIGR01509 family)